ncbi:MAG TPA: hypothetical protein VJS64_16640 [Pyrinomonadaceae bacterium]|nr:hypothetical protein [Pyrinomonadaceae bacterium]
MRILKLALITVVISLSCSLAHAQEVFTNESVPYSLELPSASWRAVTVQDPGREQLEFINGDRLDGFLQIRKEMVDSGMTATDVAHRDRDQKFRFFPGFVEGKEEKFSGRLNGVVVTYEYVKTGKPMLGRIYYFQADPRTVYALRFTGLRDKLMRIRNQTDLIARSFKLK